MATETETETDPIDERRLSDLVETSLVDLGAQAGEERTREVVTEGGFTRFRRAAETPTSLVFEAKP